MKKIKKIITLCGISTLLLSHLNLAMAQKTSKLDSPKVQVSEAPQAKLDERRPVGDFSFDVKDILSPWVNARSYSTDDFPGNDLGAKINQADAKLGDGYGIINVVGGGDFLTTAFPSEKRLIRFFPSSRVYKSKTARGNQYGQIIVLKDDSVIQGMSYDAVIEEVTEDYGYRGNAPRYSLIGNYPGTIVPYDLGESTANILKAKNIHVLGVHFRGVHSNHPNDIGISTVGFGNADNSSIQDSWFEGTTAYATAFGGTPGQVVVGATLPDGSTVGYHARNCAFLRNKLENLMAQQFAVITAVGVVAEDNLFLNPGKKPFTLTNISADGVFTTSEPHMFSAGLGVVFSGITGFENINGRNFSTVSLSPTTFSIRNSDGSAVRLTGSWRGGGMAIALSPFSTVYDVEPNGDPREIVRDIKFRRNTIDLRGSYGAYFGAIAYQITNPDIYNGGGEITDNTIIGVETGIGQLSYGININGSGADNVIVARNTIKNAGQPGMSFTGSNIRILDNQMINVGGGGSPGMVGYDLRNSVVSGNTIQLIAGGVPGSKEIHEAGANSENLWERNVAQVLRHVPSSNVINSVYRSNQLVEGVVEGPNSRGNLIE